MRTGTISASAANTLASSAAVDVKDNILLTLGDDSDAVLVLNTAGLAADAELTGVIEGTSDTLGTAVNSLLIANITDNGDIAILVSKAGSSHTAFWADGSTGDTAIMAATGASFDVYIAGTKEIDYATGALAFQQATTLSTSTGVLTIDGDDGIVLQTTGSGSVQVKELTILGTGEGGDGSTPAVGNIFRAPDIVGGTTSNVAGADITISAGLGTGTGDAGTIILQLPEVVTAGSTIQTRATVLTMDMVASTTDMAFAFTPNTVISSSGTLSIDATSTLQIRPTTGILFIGDSNVTNTKMTTGITIDQGAADDEILAFKSSDVAHGCTTIAETDTYALFKKNVGDGGALNISGLTDGGPASLVLNAFATTAAQTSKITTGRSIIEFVSYQISGTGVTNVGTNGNIFGIRGRLGGSTVSILFVDIDGHVHATDYVAGLGEGNTTGSALTGGVIRAPHYVGGTTSNVVGADLTIAAGQGTGTGDVGQLIFKTPRVGSSGSTVHTLTTLLTLDENRATLDGFVNHGAAGSLTISSGVIAVTRTYHTIVVESGTGSGNDQLDTATGGSEGDILILKPATSGGSDTVTVADGTGSDTFILAGGANFAMDHIDDRLMCVHNGTEWVEISRSSNS